MDMRVSNGDGWVPRAQTFAEWLSERSELPAAPPELRRRWDSRWGKYIPASPRAPQGRLRVALISASPIGLGFVPSVLADDGVEVVGLVTDEVIDQNARISRRRRIWRHWPDDQCNEYQARIELAALSAGVPVYSGEIKCQTFRDILALWNPEVLLVYVCGQLIPPDVFGHPPFGTYNFHPSNLTAGEYRGPGPLEGAVEDGRQAVPTACHHVDEGFDTGHVVGTGRDTRIVDDAGRHLSLRDICFALGPEGGRMARRLLAAICERREVINHLDFM